MRVQALAQVLPCVEKICIVELNKNLSYWQNREKKESKERNISRSSSLIAKSRTIFEDFDKEIEEDEMAEAVQQNKEVPLGNEERHVEDCLKKESADEQVQVTGKDDAFLHLFGTTAGRDVVTPTLKLTEHTEGYDALFGRCVSNPLTEGNAVAG